MPKRLTDEELAPELVVLAARTQAGDVALGKRIDAVALGAVS